MSKDELRAQYERLKAQAAQLLSADWEAQEKPLRQWIERLRAVTEEYDQKLAEAQARIAALERELFGPKAECLTAEQEDQLDQLKQDLRDESRRPGPVSDQILQDPDQGGGPRPRVRHRLPAHLETETITLEPPEQICPGCGKALEQIGQEVSEEIDLVPARLIRRRIVRPKYACRCGQAGVVLAPLPPRLVAQSKLGLGLAVHIVLARFDDHLSFYRLEQQFRERHGMVITRQQMVQWVQAIAGWLQPVYQAMWRALQQGGYLQVDETPVRVLDPEVKGKAARGYLWFYATPGGDIILEFDSSRGLQPVRQRLQGFTGTIQTDAYEVYQSLERKESKIDRIGCLAHARRRFYDGLKENLPQAVWFIGQIRLLYRIEDQARNLSPPERHPLRLRQAPQIWQALKARAEELKPTLLPKSTMGKAVNYLLNEYEALTGYLRDGRFEIDNNLVENSIRPTAVGRRRWLFIGHPNAGWRSAVIYSIITSCRRRGINPQDYLTDVLRRLPQEKISNIEALLPGNWKPPAIDSG